MKGLLVLLAISLIVLSGCKQAIPEIDPNTLRPVPVPEFIVSGTITEVNVAMVSNFSFPAITIKDNGKENTYIIDAQIKNLEVGRSITMLLTNYHYRGLYHLVAGEFTDNLTGKSDMLILSGGTK